ncbi:MAG: hypothetical protein V3U96_12900 [Paracoccaceae bacterium]
MSGDHSKFIFASQNTGELHKFVKPKLNIVEKRQIVLVVGQVFTTGHTTNFIAPGARLIFVEYDDVDQKVISDITPDVVMSHLMCRTFDFLDLATSLHAAKFTGCYLVIAPLLPNPDIVIAEAHSHFPELKFEFVFGPEIPDGLSN